MVSEPKPKKKFDRKKRIVVGIIIALVIIVTGSYFYHARYYPSTDDAYIDANIAYIAPQVTGQVLEVAVTNHQAVNAGDLLFTIDPSTFITNLNQAEANLKVAQATLLADEDQVRVSEANVTEAQAELVFTQKQTERTLKLLPDGYVSQSEADQATANLQTAQATLAADQASLVQAEQDVITQQSQIQAQEAAVATAKLNLSYTKVFAPTNGVVSNLTLRPGMVVNSDQELFAIVDQTSGFWVDANFEETKLKRIRVGQNADIEIDMYPGITFHGVVQSISAANGSTFSLLPPENATGNWVKVTQRFPVKVIIPESDLTQKYPLRVGASATVSVDTK